MRREKLIMFAIPWGGIYILNHALESGKLRRRDYDEDFYFVRIAYFENFRRERKFEFESFNLNSLKPPYFVMFAEGVTGCPPPDFKVSRPKGKSLTTEQPFLTFETTQLYLPQDFTTSDLEFVDSKTKDNVDRSLDQQIAQKDSSKVKENPFWFEDIIRDAEQHYSYPENVQHHHHHHNKRAKRNHHKKIKAMRHIDGGRILSKRSVDYEEEDYPQDSLNEAEVFSASEVIGNIFNENDSIPSLENGKENGEFCSI